MMGLIGRELGGVYNRTRRLEDVSGMRKGRRRYGGDYESTYTAMLYGQT